MNTEQSVTQQTPELAVSPVAVELMPIDYASDTRQYFTVRRRVLRMLTIMLVVQFILPFLGLFATLLADGNGTVSFRTSWMYFVGELLIAIAICLSVKNLITRPWMIVLVTARIVLSAAIPFINTVLEVRASPGLEMMIPYQLSWSLVVVATSFSAFFIHEAWSDARRFGQPI